ncbi:autotransporter domain-containing protein [Skermanella pratensis]|uniref:autotransporter family protein n=1 Tax=Skermanella pratensis TaxID=2233999 RepID=UPI0017882B50|nr:autotransporter domain-containing protein [Skermanella pratensis]
MDEVPYQFPAYVELRRDIVINSDLWSETSRILSADFGFEGIVGIPGLTSAADLNRAVAAGAGVNGNLATLSPAPPLRNLTSAVPVAGLPAGGYGATVVQADALPVVFGWPLLPSTVSPTDIAIRLNTGQVVTPLAAALNPNYDYNERNVIVVFGQFGNRLAPGTPGAVYPVSVEIVADDTPLKVIGPNGPQSAVGLTAASRNPYVAGPAMLGARLTRFSSVGDFAPASLGGNLRNDGASLYPGNAVYRLRLLTSGGFSPDGVSGKLPTEFARYFRLEARNAGGQTVVIDRDGVTYDLGPGIGSLKVLGLAELGPPANSTTSVYGPYYREDHDNFIDIILSGDEAAVRSLVNVVLPTAAVTGYSDIYTPGGPGTTPTPGILYTKPARPQTIAIDVKLDGQGTVSHAAQAVGGYDAADGLPVVFRLHHPVTADTIYTASTKQARSLIAQGYVEQGVPFSNEPNHSALVGVREFHSAAGTDHIYTADAAEISRLRQTGSGYADQGTVFSAIGQPTAGAGPIYRFHSAALGDHLYTPDLTEGFSKNGYAYEGISWYSAVLLPGLSGDVVFDRSDALDFSDALTGSGTLTKRGTGMLTLSAANGMTGTTAVLDGVLNVTGSLAGSAATVSSGATLAGTGTVGAVAVGGTIAPGDSGASIGTLSAIGPVTFESGSTFAAKIHPAQADRLAVASSVALDGGTLRILPQEGSYSTGTSYDVITATGGITGRFSTVDVAEPERFRGLVLNVGNSGTALRLNLATGAILTGGPDTVIFNGQALTSGIAGLGADDTAVFLGAAGSVTGDIDGSGSLVVGSSQGTLATLALEAGNQSFGTVVTRPGATLTVNSRLQAQSPLLNGGTLGGDGTVSGTVVNTGTLSPGNSPGVLKVDGAIINMGDSAALRIEVDGPTAGSGDGFHDRIEVTGIPGGFTASGTLVPVTRGFAEAEASGYTPALGQGFDIVGATGGILGGFSGLTQPTTGLPAGTRFDVSYGTDRLLLAVAPASYASLDGLTANQGAAADTVESLRPAAGTRSGTDRDTLFNSLYLTAPAAIPAALDQLAGVMHADAVTATLGTGRLFGELLADRTAAVRRGSAGKAVGPLTSFSLGATDAGTAGATTPSGNGPADGGSANGGSMSDPTMPTVWGRAVARFADTSGDGNAAGFDSTTGGFAFGLDGKMAPNFDLGVAFGYFRTDVDARRDGGSTGIDSYATAAYGSYSAGNLFADGSLTYSFSDYDSRRPIRFGTVDRTADGSSRGHGFGAALAVGYTWRTQGAIVEPAASVRYDRITRNAFSESGAQSLGLAVADMTMDTVRTGLGVRAAKRYELGGLVAEPEVRVRWDHDFLDRAADSRVSLAGAPFQVSGTEAGRDAAVLGMGFVAYLENSLEGFAGYDVELRDGSSAHRVSAGLRYRLR